MTTQEYYQNLQKEGIFIHLRPIIMKGLTPYVQDIILKLRDIDVLPELPDNLGNYFTWSGIILKKHFQKLDYKGRYKIEWHHVNHGKDSKDKLLATLVINCDTSNETDASVFQ